jgi:hypothetical protein
MTMISYDVVRTNHVRDLRKAPSPGNEMVKSRLLSCP